MNFDPRTLAVTFVLLSAVLGMLLLFAWMQSRKIWALALWGTAFCLTPLGIGLVNIGQGSPGYLNLLVANALVILAYGSLYAGCRTFNGRTGSIIPAIVFGPALWIFTFPFIRQDHSSRLFLTSLIAGGYAALSAWELWRHAPQRLASQRAAVVLLLCLTTFNFTRGMLGISVNSTLWIDALTRRWSAEMALFLVVYVPALAFIFLSMAREHIDFERKQTEQSLRESEEHYRYSVELNPQIPWIADPQGKILDVSSRWKEQMGSSVEEALGSGWIQTLHPDDVTPSLQRWSHSLSTGEPFDMEYRLRLADGSYRWARARAAARRGKDGRIIRWYGTAEDIHDRKLAEERLQWAAYYDDMTGLPNRRLFRDRLQQALDQASRSQRMIGLLVMDLDHLKTINDRFGHNAGDALLKEFARRLCSLVRSDDTIARLGGDEFAVILADASDENDIIAIAKAILAQMQEPFPWEGRVLDCRTSIGGAISHVYETAVEELVKQADLALYRSKAAGRGLFRMFHPAMREEAQKMASALDVAGRAVASGWIVPFYQPKVALASGKIVGFEALLRLHHPRMGIQAPEMIAPAFDDTELGIAIGSRMRSCIIRDIRIWLDGGLAFGRVAINASAAEFRHNDYAERVLAELVQAGVPTSCLELEVTESVFLGSNVGYIERAVHALSAAGVRIALDDFGTGYASLTHLQQFPVNVIKVDQSFIHNLTEDAGSAAITKAVVSLGRSLGIEVVAEGVETAAHASFLREHGCDVGQGYLFGRAMTGEAIPQFIQSSLGV